jgi:peptide/nickel transport system permease protein
VERHYPARAARQAPGRFRGSARPVLEDHLGLDKPMLVRYAAYVGRVAQGDLGRSIRQNRPVVDELAGAWPATLELTAAALVLAPVAGVAAVVISAVRPDSVFDALARLGSLFGLSMPVFWTGLMHSAGSSVPC